MLLKTLVLKVASRCNLNCSYCYMYNLGDTTYKKQPKVMRVDVVDQILQQVKVYTTTNNIEKFQFVFHGGEPLLVGIDWYKNFVSKCKLFIPDLEVEFLLQTNGVLYNDDWAVELSKLNIHVGFSWDGPKQFHDKFRVYHNGEGSYDDVIKGMMIYKKHFGHLAGLSVINAEFSPEDYYQNIKDLGITNSSLLFPLLHHDMKPEYDKFNYHVDERTYGNWLSRLFDTWWFDSTPKKPNIQLFIEFIGLILGYPLTSEAFGNEENDVLIIETDGGIESSSSLKSIENALTKEGNNILKTSIEEALNAPLIKLFIASHKVLPDKCQNCDLKEICGGGRINQRYSNENGFNNPSVYCNDFKTIICHIQNRLLENLNKEQLEELELNILKYEEL